MPSLRAYTPYETLAFCQSVALHGADPSAFEDIAAALNADDLVRENTSYDEKRLTATALHGLYNDLLKSERSGASPTLNGDLTPDGSNPRKRKLSPSSPPSRDAGSTDEDLVQALVEKLYARFKEELIKEIRRDEAEYANLQTEITELEGQIEVQQRAADQNVGSAIASSNQSHAPQVDTGGSAAASPSEDIRAPPSAQAEGPKPEKAGSTSPTLVHKGPKSPPGSLLGSPYPPVLPSQHSPIQTASGRSSTGPNRPSQPPPQQHSSPGAFHRTLPPPSPQRPNYGPIPPQHAYPAGPQGHPPPILHHMPGIPQMPPPLDYSNQKRPSSTSTPPRGSPMPIAHHPQYHGYPPYQQPPPWPHHMPPQHPYPQPSPYPNQPFYVQSPGGRPGPPYQTPHQSPYQPYPHTAPVHYPGHPPPGWHPAPGDAYYSHPASSQATPVPQAQARRNVIRSSGSSTPWKRRPEAPAGLRPPSPARPDRDVSPLTDTEASVTASGRRQSGRDELASQRKQDNGTGSRRQSKAPRRGRAGSTTPPGYVESRSQSLASYNSDTAPEKQGTSRRSQKIKAEPPSTPAPTASDTDQGQRISGGRRGRPRKNTATPLPDLARAGTVTKRKRSLGREASATPPPSSPAHRPRRQHHSHDPNLITVSKSFAKTANLLLSEITSHKLAGIFAKPLSERDAPGYKDFVLRPQDLKSIKAAVSKGNRAAVAAIEALDNEKDGSDETPTKISPRLKAGSGEGSLGNGMYLVRKSEDLLPPRGIVNSSQMETELIRMFANAVMFNPLPTSERGFGRSLRIRRHGGDVLATDELDAEASDDGSPADEGGIISDAKEMFEDVVEQLRKWRELEVERIGGEVGGAAGGTASARHGSVGASVRQSSVSSAVNEEDADGTMDGEAGVSTGRKRRKIATE